MSSSAALRVRMGNASTRRDAWVAPSCAIESANTSGRASAGDATSVVESPRPRAVPASEEAMAWEPALPVISARFCRRARVAEAARHATDLPRFAALASKRNCPGASGAADSMHRAPTSHPAATARHRFGSASNRSEIMAAERTAATWPRPSLITQFNEAASGAAAEPPMPTAHRSACMDNTPPAAPIAVDAPVHALYAR
eukprot:scaffold33571_cov28-Tisochrysis_lutea.AAC.2